MMRMPSLTLRWCRYLIVLLLGSVLFWMLSFFYTDPCELSFYLGITVASFLVPFTFFLCAICGFYGFQAFQKTNDDRERRFICLFTLFIAGVSCVLLITAYSIIFPRHLKYLKPIDVFIWETKFHIFFIGSEPFLIFMFILGWAISLLSFSFIIATKKHRDNCLCSGKLFRDFGLALFICGILLPILTAVFYPLTFIDYSPPAPIGAWVLPYLSHGIVLVLLSILLLAAGASLSGWASIFNNTPGLQTLTATGTLLLLWLFSAFLFNSKAFSHLLPITHIFSFSSVFLIIEAFWKVLSSYALLEKRKHLSNRLVSNTKVCLFQRT